MKRDACRVQLESVLSLAGMIRGIRIAELLAEMNVSAAVGSVFAPGLWFRDLEQRTRIVEAALKFQQVVEDVAAGGDGG